MNEARRFLRYLTPGYLFAILMFFLLWISIPKWTVSVLKNSLLDEKHSLAIIIGSIFTSGALGYLFATIHHWCHWHCPKDIKTLDHTEHIAYLRKEGLIPFEPPGSPSDTKLESLITTSVLWFERLEKNTLIGNSANNAAAISDLAHSAGAARIASFFALLMAMVICALYGEWHPTKTNIARYFVMLGIGVLMERLFCDAWRRLGKMSENIVNRILEDALREKAIEKNGEEGRGTKNRN